MYPPPPPSSIVRRDECRATTTTTTTLLLCVATSLFLSICGPGGTGIVDVIPIVTAFNLLSVDHRYGGGRRTTTTTTTLAGGGRSCSTSCSATTTSRILVSNMKEQKQINRRGFVGSCSDNHKRHDVILGAVSLLAEEQQQQVPTVTATATAVGKVIEEHLRNKQSSHPPHSRDDDRTTTTHRQVLAPEDAWIAQLDYTAFGKEVTLLGKQLLKQTGPADMEHLQKIVRWRNLAAVLGLTTVWMTPNPFTALALSTWSYASWTMIAHHTCHGGNDFKLNKKDRQDGNNKQKKNRFTSRGFGLGLQARCR